MELQFFKLDPSEKRIIEELRTLKPFERIEVCADKDGKPGVYFTTRTTKGILSSGGMQYVK